MKIYGHLRIFAFLFATFPLLTFAQHSRQSLMQPKYEDFNLKFWVRQMTVVQYYASGQDIDFQETYCFDSVGNLSTYTKHGFGGQQTTNYPLTQLNPRMQYDFDYDGDILRILEFDLKHRLISSEHYIYGSGGNLVQSIKYIYVADSGVVTKRTVSNYDKRERLSSIDQYSADELLLWSEKRKYDRRGNLVKRVQTFCNDDEVTVTTERRVYTYDRRGNWTKCRYSLNGKEIYIIERKIDYYGEQ